MKNEAGANAAGFDHDVLDVAVCQLTSVDDVSANTEHIFSILGELETQPPALVCLPENALYLRVQEGEAIPQLTLRDPVFLRFKEWAQRFSTNLHVGSVPLKDSRGLHNASLLFRSSGEVEETYRKIHLFDVDVEGHRPVRESDVFAPGTATSIFTVNGWRIGSSICYDLRFSELYHQYAKAEVDAIVIPSAFLVPTGKAHWEVLTRARAIETQSYVLAAAQGGVHLSVKGTAQRKTFGHSEIIDPWGVVLASLGGDESSGRVIRSQLKRDRIRQVRRQIPMQSHRRL